jgi:hypothetical protein
VVDGVLIPTLLDHLPHRVRAGALLIGCAAWLGLSTGSALPVVAACIGMLALGLGGLHFALLGFFAWRGRRGIGKGFLLAGGPGAIAMLGAGSLVLRRMDPGWSAILLAALPYGLAAGTVVMALLLPLRYRAAVAEVGRLRHEGRREVPPTGPSAAPRSWPHLSSRTLASRRREQGDMRRAELPQQEQ